MFERVRQEFEKYISNYDINQMEISLKYHHSYEVAELMAELAYRLDLSCEQLELAKIIGLLHDIGRFEQFKKYQSFNDKNVDHADESCNYLFKDKHIRDFIEIDKYDEIIEKAIRYHNKLELPDDLNEEVLLFSKMIRDMDKVDIYKQLAIHYQYEFKANDVTVECLRDFQQEKSINKKDKKTKTDATLIVLSFIFDINFEESFDILVSTDNFDLFLSTIEVAEDSEKLWRKVREICFDKINRGIKED